MAIYQWASILCLPVPLLLNSMMLHDERAINTIEPYYVQAIGLGTLDIRMPLSFVNGTEPLSNAMNTDALY